MSGTTNTGVVGYVSNSVTVYPSNSITVDIFGNAFYRNYKYGMGDDTGALWSNENKYNQYHMLYLTSVISTSLRGRFDYSHKLRSSKIKPFKIHLPTTDDGRPDLNFMELFIRAQQKLAIQNMSAWRTKNIEIAKQVVAI